MTVLIAATAAALFGIGTHLVLQRKLSRIIIGLGLMSHGGNLLLMTSGRRGIAPLIGSGDAAEFSDPLPQALALTAIVITFGVTGLLLALAYRSWLLTDDDEVADDDYDRRIMERRTEEDFDIRDAAEAPEADPDDAPDPIDPPDDNHDHSDNLPDNATNSPTSDGHGPDSPTMKQDRP